MKAPFDEYLVYFQNGSKSGLTVATSGKKTTTFILM